MKEEVFIDPFHLFHSGLLRLPFSNLVNFLVFKESSLVTKKKKKAH